MKYKYYLKKVVGFLDERKQKRRKRRECMTVVLNEPDRKEDKVKARMHAEKDSAARKRLEQTLAVLQAQRNQGIEST